MSRNRPYNIEVKTANFAASWTQNCVANHKLKFLTKHCNVENALCNFLQLVHAWSVSVCMINQLILVEFDV